MAEEKKIELANEVYKTLCGAMDKRGWNYKKDEGNLVVYFGVSGDDIPMDFVLAVDVERQLIRLMSPMPYKISEPKRMEGAIATCIATYGLADGSFDYDITEGSIIFRMTASFRESLIGEGLLQYMISCSCAMVDEYNDKFLAIDKGLISINDFLSQK